MKKSMMFIIASMCISTCLVGMEPAPDAQVNVDSSYEQKKEQMQRPEEQEKNKRYNCKWCDKSFSRQCNAKRHERSHVVPQAVHTCDTCGQLFIRPAYLALHMKKIHQKNNRKKMSRYKFIYDKTHTMKIHKNNNKYRKKIGI